ncbi:preprotein translocase subunit SecA [Candidatus Peregrinibacteria bacterium]|nr:preprotein translocase subunit SecA [Candidatus Peregrinibacteria bacterium]
MIRSLLGKIIGDANEKEVRRLRPLIEKINEIEEKYQKTLTDEDLPRKTEEFKKRIIEGESLDDLLPEAFALVKNACRRLTGKKWEVRGHETEWNMIPYDVQLIGGIVLHHGKIAEMKTGEGKTLVCTMPVYLNALTKKGVFIVTVNDYLAQRDAEWMGGVYKFLGLTVGVVKHGQNATQKKEAYDADITYGTNNEFGFDYLRDNMATSLEQVVQRNLYYSIVDEVDSILIDEARTPLIISAPAEESTFKYRKYAELIKNLAENEDYNIDEKIKTATLTEAGIAKMEKMLGVENIYTEGGFLEVHHIEQSLRAHACYKRDVDYVVKENEVIIVDEFTGRLMPGRRYSDGLHQAIEAKENVEVKRESKTLATVSLQNYFRLFDKLAGMTGTAATEAEEFYKIYKLDTVIIPTNMNVMRKDLPDVIYKNTKGKFLAVTQKVKELHEKGQPALIGTISIEKSETLSKLLQMNGIQHNVLNAKNHEREAEIVANAGQKGAVTIATNMAGRGTDIKLGEGVVEVGGLCIMGTERHESRRIDNQLRGRAGRQGDPGASQFYVSMEDDLMRLFGSEKVQNMMERLGIPDDMPIENRLISNSIESAQKRVEGRNFDIRKHLVEYDDVMNKHREIIYSRRRKILESSDVKADILILFEKESKSIVLNHTSERDVEDWNYEEILETVRAIHRDAKTKNNMETNNGTRANDHIETKNRLETNDHAKVNSNTKTNHDANENCDAKTSHDVNHTSNDPITKENLEKIIDRDELIKVIHDYLINEYEKKEKSLSSANILRQIERSVYLRVIDSLWMEHIDEMSNLRESVALQGYGQRDPLIEYKSEAFNKFTKLLTAIQSNTVNTLFKVNIEQEVAQRLMEEMVENLQTNEDEIEGVLTGDQKKLHDQIETMRRTAIDESPTVIRINADKDENQTDTHFTAPLAHPGVPQKFQTAQISPVIQKKSNQINEVGRNEPCPCGSGKKYKKCHGKGK